jgi:hypothetical protein
MRTTLAYRKLDTTITCAESAPPITIRTRMIITRTTERACRGGLTIM